MAKIKRVFVVEGIDDGAPISKELIQEANRLLEDGGLDVASTARSAILTDLLGSGTSARVLAFMSPSDISGVYSQPGGVTKFIESAMSTPADVTKVLQMLNSKLPTGAGNWLQQMPNKRMSLEDINGPEDAVVMLNVPKNVFNYTKINTPEEAKKKLQEILAHTNFKLHLNVHEAKAGLDPTELNATSVNQQLLDKFNFEAISGYSKKDTRVAAVAEWKKAREGHAARKKDDGNIESPAHQFADWIEEYRLEHRLPKTESAAYEFYFKAKAKLDELSQGNPKLRRAAREAGVKMVKPDSGLWEKLATGDIDGYMKVIKARADASGETLPKDDKPKVKPEEPPKEPPKEPPQKADERVDKWGITQLGQHEYYLMRVPEDGERHDIIGKIDHMDLEPDGTILFTGTRDWRGTTPYTATANAKGFHKDWVWKPLMDEVEVMSRTNEFRDEKMPEIKALQKKLNWASFDKQVADRAQEKKDASAKAGTAKQEPKDVNTPADGTADSSAKLPSHVQGALSDYAKNLKKIADKNKLSTKDLLAAINKEIDSPD